jgi:hypothetical protein
MKKFRANGAKGALMDEYERALNELISVIQTLTGPDIKMIADKETDNPDCVSIQSVLSHVIRAGYNYCIAIRNWLGEEVEYRETELLNTAREYRSEIKKMFQYSEKLFSDYPDIRIEEHAEGRKIKVRWGQLYDIEQLMEHAIVHVLRHRRQIEKFIIRLEE